MLDQRGLGQKDYQARKFHKEDAMAVVYGKADKGWLIRIDVSGRMFLLVPAHPDRPRQWVVSKVK